MKRDEAKLPEAITSTQLRKDLRRVIDTACYFGQRYLILRSGVPAVVLLGLEDYRRLTVAAGEAVETGRG